MHNETNINGAGLLNVTSIKRVEISEEALLFLTGSVSTILIPSFYTLVCLLIMPINICAVVAFTLRIKPKKPAAIYMLNLACADLLFAVLLPFKIFYDDIRLAHVPCGHCSLLLEHVLLCSAHNLHQWGPSPCCSLSY
ncbi:unnamed protein product [Pleuronectes platessa]|uniref:G-protein coupled receptors family 1 profile domain-containing protein n=1 Tax=Pleuronectes platessa TaxID=8262 RepID=A0A9N7VC71_PLEPL|nr:unnamed protein product [Pleuronectes platessa]